MELTIEKAKEFLQSKGYFVTRNKTIPNFKFSKNKVGRASMDEVRGAEEAGILKVSYIIYQNKTIINFNGEEISLPGKQVTYHKIYCAIVEHLS